MRAVTAGVNSNSDICNQLAPSIGRAVLVIRQASSEHIQTSVTVG